MGADDLRFDVLRGRVVVAGGSSAGSLFDFKVPIANAWLVSKGKLVPINLFNSKNLAPGARSASTSSSKFLTYIGSFNNQYYLQHSNQIRDLVSLRNGKEGKKALEWVTGPMGVSGSCESEKKPHALTYVDKMTPSAGKTRSDVESTELAIRVPAIAPGVYLRPVNEPQLEVGKRMLKCACRLT